MIVQAIETRYIGPTNTKGGRIKARAWAGSVTVPYDHGLSTEDNHRKAAMKLAAKFDWISDGLDWIGEWAQGGNAKGDGYCFVRSA